MHTSSILAKNYLHLFPFHDWWKWPSLLMMVNLLVVLL